MTQETPIRPREVFEPVYETDDLADAAELLRRAAEYAIENGDPVMAAELREAAAVVDAEVAGDE